MNYKKLKEIIRKYRTRNNEINKEISELENENINTRSLVMCKNDDIRNACSLKKKVDDVSKKISDEKYSVILLITGLALLLFVLAPYVFLISPLVLFNVLAGPFTIASIIVTYKITKKIFKEYKNSKSFLKRITKEDLDKDIEKAKTEKTSLKNELAKNNSRIIELKREQNELFNSARRMITELSDYYYKDELKEIINNVVNECKKEEKDIKKKVLKNSNN